MQIRSASNVGFTVAGRGGKSSSGARWVSELLTDRKRRCTASFKLAEGKIRNLSTLCVKGS